MRLGSSGCLFCSVALWEALGFSRQRHLRKSSFVARFQCLGATSHVRVPPAMLRFPAQSSRHVCVYGCRSRRRPQELAPRSSARPSNSSSSMLKKLRYCPAEPLPCARWLTAPALCSASGVLDIGVWPEGHKITPFSAFSDQLGTSKDLQ